MGRYLLKELHGIPLPQDQGAGRDTTDGRLSGSLASTMPILDNAVAEVGTLGQLLLDLLMLMQENSRLCERLDDLSLEILAQGGVVLDGLGFISKAQVMAECPEGDAFEGVLDSILLFCCDPSCIPVTGWEKMIRAMEEDYSPTAWKVVASYY